MNKVQEFFLEHYIITIPLISIPLASLFIFIIFYPIIYAGKQIIEKRINDRTEFCKKYSMSYQELEYGNFCVDKNNKLYPFIPMLQKEIQS